MVSAETWCRPTSCWDCLGVGGVGVGGVGGGRPPPTRPGGTNGWYMSKRNVNAGERETQEVKFGLYLLEPGRVAVSLYQCVIMF
mmetsp:Transcript_25878/g.56111  ORF Transcript_25878/g.56111 Transcript_25878/m.56111 type:complete len:84 (+) Transcript_25878:3173-3424(+)